MGIIKNNKHIVKIKMRFTLIIAALVAISSAVSVDVDRNKDGEGKCPKAVKKAMNKALRKEMPDCRVCNKEAQACLRKAGVQSVDEDAYATCFDKGKTYMEDCLAAHFEDDEDDDNIE